MQNNCGGNFSSIFDPVKKKHNPSVFYWDRQLQVIDGRDMSRRYLTEVTSYMGTNALIAISPLDGQCKQTGLEFQPV